MTHMQWRIEFFGHFTLRAGDMTHTRFFTHKVAVLLARLAYQKNRQFGREEIVDMLWPDSDLRAGRVSLRTALTSLRRQLEPPGTSSVLIADHTHICLNPEAFTTDVAEFEAWITQARTGAPSERERCLQRADALYQGELLPGFYEDWILLERSRLAQMHTGLLMELCLSAQQRGDLQAAISYVSRCLAANPLEEAAHTTLIDLLLQTGRRRAAQEQYARMWRIWDEQLGDTPSRQTQDKAQAWQLEPGVPRLPARKSAVVSDPKTHSALDTASASKAASASNAASASDAAQAVPAPDASSPSRTAAGATDAELPLTLTRLFGRDEEIDRLCEVLQKPDARLLTLTGMGGMGKTRLAIEVARRLALQWAGRIVFVALADVMEAERIPERILSSLHIPPEGKTPVAAQVMRALQAEPTLLLLDNYEQLLPAGAELLLVLLEQAPTLRCFVTSRHTMDILGERAYSLTPLPVPQEGDSPESLMQCPSVQLLQDRARLTQPDFQITARNRRAVIALCQELEGLPLALELTAARIQMMTVGQMVGELQDRLKFLVSRKRNIPARHQSLHATLDWSYGLLTPRLQYVLTRLSVFRGGWSWQSAQEVCEDADILTALEELAAASLIRTRQEDGSRQERELDMTAPQAQPRFVMLEALREFASDMLSETERQAARHQHLSCFLRLAERAEPELRGPRQSDWFTTLETEYANFLAALAWAESEGSVEEGLRLATALWYYWAGCGYRNESRRWIEAFLSLPPAADRPVSKQARAAGLYALSNIAQAQGDYDRAEAASLESLAIYREVCDSSRTIACLNSLATLAYFRQDYAGAAGRFEEVIALAREQNDVYWLSTALLNLATTYDAQGRGRLALPMYEEALAWCEQKDNLINRVHILVSIAHVLRDQGKDAQAQAYVDRAMQIVDTQTPSEAVIWCLLIRGQLAGTRGDATAAAQDFDEAIALADRLSSPRGKGAALRHRGSLACLAGDYDDAEQLYEESAACFRQIKSTHSLLEIQVTRGHMALRRGMPGQAASLYRQALGEWRSRQDSVWLEQAFRGMAEAEGENRLTWAARLLSAAVAMRERMGTRPSSRMLPDPAIAVQRLTAHLGDTEFTRLWDEASTLSCQEALHLALE